MKITLIGPAYPLRGGNALFVAHLYEALSAHHSVDVVSFSRLYPSILFPGVRQNDISSSPLKKHPARALLDSVNPFTWISAAKDIRSKRPDVVIFTWWNPFFGPLVRTAASIIRKAGIPVVIVAENVISHEGRAVDHALTKIALDTADAFLVLSKVVEETVQQLYPKVPLFRSTLPVYDCYQSGDILPQAAAKERLNLAGKEVILFFGYIREYKGLMNLIEAFPKVKQHIPNAHLLIVGEFYKNPKEYYDAIERQNLKNDVTIVAEYVANEEVHKYFTASNVVVLPYNEATQSGIMSIAQSFGTPAIVTNVGGLGELLEDGKTGFIVEPRNVPELADSIIRYFKEGREKEFSAEVVRRSRANSFNTITDVFSNIFAALKIK